MIYSAPRRSPQAARYILTSLAVIVATLIVATVAALHFTRPPIPYAASAASQEQTLQARVLTVITETATTDASGLVLVSQELELEVRSAGEAQGTRVTVAYNGMGPSLRAVRFRVGESALLMVSRRPDGRTFYTVADHVRLGALALFGAIFAGIILVMGRGQGFRALLGLLLSGLLIGGFILPQILAQRDPLLVSLVGAALLLGATLYLIQGWNVVAHTSFLGGVVSLGFTGLLAIAWTGMAHLTGFGSEETLYLQAIGVGVEMRGLLLAGMILGAAGVLDDVILAQAVAAFEIHATDPTLPRREVYRRGMKVGTAHLHSMVNTLILAYAGAALPLIILFYLYPEPWYLTLNREMIAEEIVRTLVGSVGLMLAVPLTTLIASWVAVTQTPTALVSATSTTGTFPPVQE